MKAAAILAVSAVPADGDSFTVNGVPFTIRTTITDATPRDIRLIPASETGGDSLNARYAQAFVIAAAINADAPNSSRSWRRAGTTWTDYQLHSTGAGRDYSSATTASTEIKAVAHNDRVFIVWIGDGSGHGTAVSKTGTALAWREQDNITSTATLKIQWRVGIEGATGTWASLNRHQLIQSGWLATYQSTTTFSVPFNSSSAGSFVGQSLVVARQNSDHHRFIRPHGDSNWYGEWLPGNMSEGEVQIAVPDCTLGTTPEIECARAFNNPFSNKAYGNWARISSFVVSGTSITISLAVPFTAAFSIDTLGANAACVFIYGYRAYSTSTNPGYAGTPNAPGQDAAKWFMKPSTSIYGQEDPSTMRCFYPTAVPSSTSFSIANPGLANGTYIAACPLGECPANSVTTQGLAYITSRADPSFYIRTSLNGSNVSYQPQDHWSRRVKGTPLSPNRMVMWIRLDGRTLKPTGSYNFNLGTYPLSPADLPLGGGTHFYHFLDLGFYANQWQKLVFTPAANHQVGGTGGKTWPANASCGHGYYPGWRGDYGHPCEGYFSLQQTAYVDFAGLFRRASNPDNKGFGGGTLHIGRLELDTVQNEPVEYVKGASIQWSPERTIDNAVVASQGLEMAWSAPDVLHAAGPTSFIVRYSTSGSLHTNGWSTGSSGGTVVAPATGGQYHWVSPSMAQPANAWVGIRPLARVWGTSRAGENIWLVLPADLGVSATDTVTVSGVTGNTAANQTNVALSAVQGWQVWHRFRPQPSGTWSTPHHLTSIVTSGDSVTCTVNLSVSHNIVPGWLVEVVGSTNPTLGQIPLSDQNPKVYRVLTTPSSQSFTFACPSGLPANTTYNTDSAVGVHLAVVAYPGVRLPGTSNADFISGGTVVATSDTKHFFEISLSASDPSPSSVGITTASLPNGVQNMAYAATLTAAGGSSPYSWSVAGGALPTGISLGGGGVLAGIPMGTGTSTVTIRVTDSTGATADRAFSLTIGTAVAPLSMIAPSDVAGTVGLVGEWTWPISGGSPPYSCSLIAGTLPGWATLTTSSAQCRIFGIPDSAASIPLTLRATDSESVTASASGTLAITNQAQSEPIVLTAPLVSHLLLPVDQSASVAFVASGGTPPYTCSLSGGLPVGLSLSGCNIEGTPTELGSQDVTVTVSDSAGLTASASAIVRTISRLGLVVSARAASSSALVRVSAPGMDANTPCTYVVRTGENLESTATAGTVVAGAATRIVLVAINPHSENRVDVRCGTSHSGFVTLTSAAAGTRWQASHPSAADALVEWGTSPSLGSSIVAPCAPSRVCSTVLPLSPEPVYVRHTWRNAQGTILATSDVVVIVP